MPPRRATEIAVSSVVAVPPTVSSTTRGLLALPHAWTSASATTSSPSASAAARWCAWRAEITTWSVWRPGDGGRQQADRAGAEDEHGVVGLMRA